MNPIVFDWSLCLALGFAGCFLIAFIQEAVWFVQRWRQ